jgi:hypothetical protein
MVAATAPAGPVRPWWKKRWGIAAIAVGVLLVLGAVGSAFNPKGSSTASPIPSAPVAAATAGPTPNVTASPSATAQTTPSAAPTATAEPTPEPTAEPTPTPKPTPVPPVLTKAGRGDKVLKFPAQDGPLVARITNKSGDNFAVVAYSGTEYTDLLVNEIGSYSGRVYVAPGVNLLKITSGGSWTVELRVIASAPRWNGESTLTGKGDSVILLTGGSFGTTTITNKGRDNFAVVAYSVDGDYLDLLVNEIGSYRGEVLLPIEDPVVLSIHAVGGAWTMTAVK